MTFVGEHGTDYGYLCAGVLLFVIPVLIVYLVFQRCFHEGMAGAVEGNDWNFKRFNPKHFQLVEKSIEELRDLSIEADLIVMHPYDRWGFSMMDREEATL